jgi:hypothetical protein
LKNTAEVASVGVEVEALDDSARALYRHHEFTPLLEHSHKLFLAMATIEKALRAFYRDAGVSFQPNFLEEDFRPGSSGKAPILLGGKDVLAACEHTGATACRQGVNGSDPTPSLLSASRAMADQQNKCRYS